MVTIIIALYLVFCQAQIGRKSHGFFGEFVKCPPVWYTKAERDWAAPVSPAGAARMSMGGKQRKRHKEMDKNAAPLQRRAGGVDYELTRKRVKNINLRVRRDGSVAVSAPCRTSFAHIDAFVAGRAEWIAQARAQVLAAEAEEKRPCAVPREQALALFTEISDAVFPLFAQVLDGQHPVLKVRQMKTRWGVCAPAKRQITLNLRLAEKPRAAVEYVVLHEYAHFVHPNHGPAFWALVARYLPDYRARRALLKASASAEQKA